MKERPILFSGLMVRAILDGCKTQTRRIVSARDPWRPHPSQNWARWPLLSAATLRNTHALFCREVTEDERDGKGDLPSGLMALPCPYGVPGDRLWARETFALSDDLTDPDAPSVVYRADGEIRAYSYKGALHGRRPWMLDDLERKQPGCFMPKWTPSIHMPRWASRIALEVTGVRVERVQDISEEDARAEGVDWAAPHPYGEKWSEDDREDPREVGYNPAGSSFARDNFRRLWDSINGKRAPWASNPWVWCVSFKRVQS